jgi:hypothetical protein
MMYVGTSLGGCLLGIMNNEVSEDDVMFIVTRTLCPDYDTFITLFDGTATIIDHPPVSPGVAWNGVEFDYQEEGLSLEEILIQMGQAADTGTETE